jgi:hypothetical protein
MKKISVVNDIDDVTKNIIDQMDYSEEEIIYKSEIDGQIKIFIFAFIVSNIMIICSLII